MRTFADLDASAIDPLAWESLGIARWGDITRLASRGIGPAAFADPDPEVRAWAVAEREQVVGRPRIVGRLRSLVGPTPEHLVPSPDSSDA